MSDAHEWFDNAGGIRWVRDLQHAILDDKGDKTGYECFRDAMQMLFRDPHDWARTEIARIVLGVEDNGDGLECMKEAAMALLPDGDELLSFTTRRGGWMSEHGLMTIAEQEALDGKE